MSHAAAPMLDTAIAEETPEGIEISLLPAGVWARGLAFLLDEALRWMLILGGFFVGQFAGVFGYGLGLLVWFGVYWLYGVAFEVLNNGRTPGKQLRRLQVVHRDGTPIRLPASLLRNLLLWVDALPGVYLAGIVTMCLSPRFQRLGDLVAGTMVVYQGAPWRAAGSAAALAAATGAASAAAPATAPATASRDSMDPADATAPAALQAHLTREERAALVDFAERRDGFSPDRRQELAAVLAPLLGDEPARAEQRLARLTAELTGGEAEAAPGS